MKKVALHVAFVGLGWSLAMAGGCEECKSCAEGQGVQSAHVQGTDAPKKEPQGQQAGASSDALGGPSVVGTDEKLHEVVNRFCPVMPKKAIEGKVPTEFVLEWNGQEIGFCCDDCVEAWKGFDDDVRAKRLAKVLKK